MKLFFAPASPYVRKCLVAAHELGLAERIEKLPSAAHPVNRDRTIIPHNPLGKVPTLFTDDGTVLYDSRVIVEYLDSLAGGKLIPRDGPARYAMLVEQALADGMLDAALIARYEDIARPEPLRWPEWRAGQLDKIVCGLAELETRSAKLGERVDLGTIAFGCVLGYIDFRFPEIAWRDTHPSTKAWFARFGARPSMVATRPHA
jgi:glutathione S-transferase